MEPLSISASLALPVVGHNATHNLFCTLYPPQLGAAKGTFLILHGMQEHSGRYIKLAHYLVAQGYAVLTYDHLGHGRSVHTGAELGFFQLQFPKEQLIQDAQWMADYLQQKYPKIPHYILGHSMGSFITRCLLQNTGHTFSGAVIVGTGAKPFGLELLLGLTSLLNKLAPYRRSSLLNAAFRSRNNMRFRKEVDYDGSNWLSLNKENRKAFNQDPLCGGQFTNNGFYTLFSLMYQATRKDWWQGIPKNLPMLFISGEDDPIGDFGKGVKNTAAQLIAHGFENIRVKLKPYKRHEVLLDTD